MDTSADYRVVTFDMTATEQTIPLYQIERHSRLFGFAEDLITLMAALDISDAN